MERYLFSGESCLRSLGCLLLLFASVCLLHDRQTFAQQLSGSVFDEEAFESEILGGVRKYAVYLPPDYNASRRHYPCLYLLHGAGDDQTGWIQFGEVLRIADQAIASGKATPMVIIMPDANTGRRGYFNDVRGDWRYEDFFFDELIPEVERRYRIRSEKRYRAVAGLSMGGGGTFMYALHRPEMFGSACPLSASCGPLTLEDAKRHFSRGKPGTELPPLPDDEVVDKYFRQHSAVELVRNMPDKERRSVRWYIDCGDEDFLYEGNSLVHIEMRKKGVPHEYRVRDGEHNWTYWRESLPEVLHFVSEGFHQH